jgi:hypothetical protein
VIVGIRPKRNDEGFRFIFKDRNDAVVVDAAVHQKTSNGLFMMSYPPAGSALRIRDGFARTDLPKTRKREPFALSLRPKKRLTDAKSQEQDFLALHEERMKRITTLKRTLVGLFEIKAGRPIDADDERPSEVAMRWRGFPVRPPPVRARMYEAKAKTTNPLGLPPLRSARLAPRRLPKVRRTADLGAAPDQMSVEPTLTRMTQNARLVPRTAPHE